MKAVSKPKKRKKRGRPKNRGLKVIRRKTTRRRRQK